MDSIMNYPTNWKRMQIFDYKCHSNLPLDIQKLIILYSEYFWYNETVDKIIKYWYAYIGKKIAAQYIYSKMKIEPIEVYPYFQHNLYLEPITVYLIDPLKNYNQIIYVCKILKGTEDKDFWRSFFEKVACGLIFIYKNEITLINKISSNYDINAIHDGVVEIHNSLSNEYISRLNKLITINNYIINVRDKYEFPIFIESFILYTLLGLKKYDTISYNNS